MSHEMDPTDNEVRVLRRLTDELRMATPPPLDWQRVESEVMRRTELEAVARRRQPAPLSRLGGFAAVAAGVVLLIAANAQRSVVVTPTEAEATVVDVRSLATFEQAPDALPRYRVSALKPRSVVESAAEPMQFELENVAQWTLSPHSRALVRTTSVPHVVALERGTIDAEVVPRHDANAIVEAFVVEVGGTRVAVHGTVFSVERAGDVVHVEVTRGTVTVGPTSYRGPTTGFLLSSPARAAFVAATGRFIERLPMRPAHDTHAPEAPRASLDTLTPPATPSDPPVHDPEHPSTDDPKRPLPAGPRPAPNASAAPTDVVGDPEPVPPPPPSKLTVSAARAIVSSCLHEHAKDKTFVISSTVTVRLEADGAVASMQFAPPLNPKFQAPCGSLLFGKLIEGDRSVSFGVSSQ